MKRFVIVIVCAFLIVAATNSFKITSAKQNQRELPSTTLVISQFQTAGTSATDEFIELHNVSSGSIDLNGYRVVYRSAAGTGDVPFVDWTTPTIIPAGGYYLIASTAYGGAVAPNITYNPSSCSCSMSASGGGIGIRQGAANTGTLIDSVGYGTATNAFIEGSPTAAPAALTGQARANNGCQDTDNNANDFINLNPANPRNLSSGVYICGSPGSNLTAVGAANPNPVEPGATTLLTVQVTPADNPLSTGIQVTANLTAINGSATQRFYDDGTNGDITPGDNIFSYSYTILPNATGGVRNLAATATDAQGRSASATIALNINAPAAVENPLLLGNPSNAVTDINQPNNYLMVKPQYALSYNRDKATANWVAWTLNANWLGTTPRQNDFRPDPDLPAAWYRVQSSDYTGSGWTRGHMCPSSDRTKTVADNSATFLMTNILPQSSSNNSGPWNELENYLRSQAQANKLYIFSGGAGTNGRIGSGCGVTNGCVNIPLVTWKVAMILPPGDNDLQRVNKNTRVIAVIVPNNINVNINWRLYRVSVRQVEALTGLNFFSNVPKPVQRILKSRIDDQ
jgi:endonuclease G